MRTTREQQASSNHGRAQGDRYRQQWESLGRADPYWAVLTHPHKKGNRWNREEFFQTGNEEIESLLATVRGLGLNLKSGVALDFGCGVGRLSRALACFFDRVIAVDISEAMLNEARSANRGYGNIDFLQTDGSNLAQIVDADLDLVYSNIVLQHLPARRQSRLIRDLCRLLLPGAVLVFQTPSHPDVATIRGCAYLLLSNSALGIARRIVHGRDLVFEMHTLRKHQVLEILEEEAMTISAVERYDSAGKGFISYRYFAVKW